MGHFEWGCGWILFDKLTNGLELFRLLIQKAEINIGIKLCGVEIKLIEEGCGGIDVGMGMWGLGKGLWDLFNWDKEM